MLNRSVTALLTACLACCVMLSLAACDDSNNQPATAAKPALPPPTDETLLLQIPPAWLEVTAQTSDAFRLAEYVPAGQSREEWLDKLFVESNTLKPLPDPLAFLEVMGEELKTECEGSSDANIHSGIENGYETSVRLLICNKNLESARGEVTLIKAIRGTDNFYVISRARRSEPLQNEQSPLSSDEMAAWSLYMRSIKLCDPRSAEHPCPTT